MFCCRIVDLSFFSDCLINYMFRMTDEVPTMDLDGEENNEIEETPEKGFHFQRGEQPVSQGAEARIFPCVYLGREAIMKQRFNKKYRHPLLDSRLNKQRVKAELKGIMKAKSVGVETPAVYFIDGDNDSIIMERVNGCSAKEWIEQQRPLGKEHFEAQIKLLGSLLGERVARLHAVGLVHGDLTTSNILLRFDSPNNIVFIDFGLSSQMKVTAEEKGVDMYVLERAIASTHHDSGSLFESFLSGYSSSGGKQASTVLSKLNEIRLRGRKRDMIG